MFLHVPGRFETEQWCDPIEQRRGTADAQRVGAGRDSVLGKITGSLKIIVPDILISCLEAEQFRNLAREFEVDLITEAIGTGAERRGKWAVGVGGRRFL